MKENFCEERGGFFFFFEGVSCVVISPSLSMDEGVGMLLLIQTKWWGRVQEEGV